MLSLAGYAWTVTFLSHAASSAADGLGGERGYLDNEEFDYTKLSEGKETVMRYVHIVL